MFVTGPASAILPNWETVVRPRTITAPGAMNTIPVRAERMTPNLRPEGSALNSAQHPYLFAIILCAISCRMKAGAMVRRDLTAPIIKAAGFAIAPVMRPENMNPSATVNASVANPRSDISFFEKCHTELLFGHCADEWDRLGTEYTAEWRSCS